MAWLGEVNSGVFRTWKVSAPPLNCVPQSPVPLSRDLEDSLASLRTTSLTTKSTKWQDLAFLRKNWDGPIILKGIMCVEDALLAQEASMDAIIVSNHGGRQVDGSLASLDALVDICSDERICPREPAALAPAAPALGTRPTPSLRHPSRKMAVLFDSGIRSGSDVIKALAIGADAVLLGRPYLYGLAIDGERGVEHVVRTVLSEVDVTLGLMGKRTVGELSRSDLRKSGA